MKINLQNYDEYFFNYVEGNLSTEEMAETAVFLKQNPMLQPEFDAWKESVLKPDISIAFSEKSILLKKEPARIIPFFSNLILMSGVAASIVAVLILKILLDKPAVDLTASNANRNQIEFNRTLIKDSTNPIQNSIPVYKTLANQPKHIIDLNLPIIENINPKLIAADSISAIHTLTAVQLNSHRRVATVHYKTIGALPASGTSTEVENWLSVASIAISQLWHLTGHSELIADNQLKIAANQSIDLNINTRLIKIQKRFFLFHKNK